MTSHWPKVRLAQLLRPASRPERVDPAKEYALVGVRLDGKGPFHRETVLGSTTSATVLARVQAGDFIYSRLFAWRGAFGVVGPELDGHYASGEFPTFLPADDRLDLDFLRLWFRVPSVLAQVIARSSGSTPTTRNRLREDQFLSLEIPVPPLDEQRRILTRLEAVEARHHEADLLRNQVSEILDLMLPAVVDAELARLRALGHPVSAVANHAVLVTSGPRDFAANYTLAGPRFYRAQDIGPEGRIGDDNVVCVRLPQGRSARATVLPGDVLVVITGATIGRSAVVEDHHAEGLVSQHVGLIRVDHRRLDPRYLHLAMLAPSWAGGQLQEHKYGQGKPGLNLGNLRDLRFPLPSMPEQHRVVEHVEALCARLLPIKRSHVRITADLREFKRLVLTQMMTSRTTTGAPPHASPW